MTTDELRQSLVARLTTAEQHPLLIHGHTWRLLGALREYLQQAPEPEVRKVGSYLGENEGRSFQVGDRVVLREDSRRNGMTGSVMDVEGMLYQVALDHGGQAMVPGECLEKCP